MLDDEYDDDGSDSRSAGTCTFPFRFGDSVGHAVDSAGRFRGIGSSSFFPIGIDSIGVVFRWSCLY